MIGIVLEHRANLTNRKIEAMLEIDMDFGSPHLFNYLFSSDDFAGPACERRQNFCRLRLKLYRRPVTAKLSAAAVQFEFTEENALSRLNLVRQIRRSNAKFYSNRERGIIISDLAN